MHLRYLFHLRLIIISDLVNSCYVKTVPVKSYSHVPKSFIRAYKYGKCSFILFLQEKFHAC